LSYARRVSPANFFDALRHRPLAVEIRDARLYQILNVTQRESICFSLPLSFKSASSWLIAKRNGSSLFLTAQARYSSVKGQLGAAAYGIYQDWIS
jgi:hypothetical protein